MISYEASKWYVKLWRKRWYLYAIFLYLQNYINIGLWIDYFFNEGFTENDKRNIRANWKDIKTSIELSKMYKFSTKNINHEREC
jgi:hypothetical protein